MNGVINIYKEAGYSSFHVVYEIRKLTGEQKVGHTGTLDPHVRGVLPVCIGKATKLVGQLTDTDKTYSCTMFIGRATDTQDYQGRTISEMDRDQVRKILTQDETADPFARICEVLHSFEGDIMQTPPMFSALKVGGMKLVNAARKGLEVERKPRCVTIYSIDNIRQSSDLLYVSFDVRCSKGTYIRTLCNDAGEKLGIPCCMYELERICAAGLGKESAITLEQARLYSDQGVLSDHIIPTDRFLENYPRLTVRDHIRNKVIYGNYFSPDDTDMPLHADDAYGAGTYRVYDRSGEFYALYRFDPRDSMFKCVKMFKDI